MRDIKTGPWERFMARKVVDGVPSMVPARRRSVEYTASVWDGPLSVGETGRRRDVRCHDVLTDILGEMRFLNTAPNCSFHSALIKQCRT